MKARAISNAYFPLLIPEKFLHKEKEHFEGFEAEAVTATRVGDEEIEPLVIRPTSETVMYDIFAKWIRSHEDLPLKINQWCNVLRYDTKGTKPFIRDREFLWMELHTVHATEQDALQEIEEYCAISQYANQLACLYSLPLKRTPSDTFPGGEFSVAFDTLVQDGRVFQGPGGHYLGQNFAKVFDISFTDENENKQLAYQACLGISTRQIGGILMMHGDDKGAILPPALAPIQVVIIPILFKGKEKDVLAVCEELRSTLESLEIRTKIDDSKQSPGFKFNQYELKGVPIRIEIGPKDIEAGSFIIVRRTDSKKQELKDVKEIPKILDELQEQMYENSKQFVESNIKDITNIKELKNPSGFLRANWCSSEECEAKINEHGVEVRGTRYDKKEKPFGDCIVCGKKAKHVIYIAKAY
jgi:prolyl-tRNA synthetase